MATTKKVASKRKAGKGRYGKISRKHESADPRGERTRADSANKIRERLFEQTYQLRAEWRALANSTLADHDARGIADVLDVLMVGVGRLVVSDGLEDASKTERARQIELRRERASNLLTKYAASARETLGRSSDLHAGRAAIRILERVIGAQPDGGDGNASVLTAFIAVGPCAALQKDTPLLPFKRTGIDKDGRPYTRIYDSTAAHRLVKNAFSERVRRDDWTHMRPAKRMDALILVGLMALGCAEIRARNLLR